MARAGAPRIAKCEQNVCRRICTPPFAKPACGLLAWRVSARSAASVARRRPDKAHARSADADARSAPLPIVTEAHRLRERIRKRAGYRGDILRSLPYTLPPELSRLAAMKSSESCIGFGGLPLAICDLCIYLIPVFESDTRKAAANLRKHGVSFDEAATVFADPDALDVRI